MPLRFKTGAVLLLLILTWGAGARAQDRKIDIIPFVGLRAGGTFADGASNETLAVDEAMGYGLTVDWDYDATGQLQLLWSRQSSDFKAPGTTIGHLHLDIDYYHFGGAYSWSNDEKYRPYLVFSVGGTHFRPTDSGFDDELRFSMGLGLGLKYFLTPRIGLMVEGRGYGTFMGGTGEIFCGDGSCRIRIDSDLFVQIEGRTGIVFRF